MIPAATAAATLQKKLELHSWFIAVGVTGPLGDPELIVYGTVRLVKQDVPDKWEGYRVVARATGRPVV